MSNTTNSLLKSSFDINQISEILLWMDKYILIIIYLTGLIGSILNIITFIQKEIRINSCSIYFFFTSITDFCIMNIFILMEIISSLNENIFHYIYENRIWCKLGNYLMFIFPCLSSSYICMASIDRYCSSSLNQNIRKFNHFKISRICSIIIFIFWSLVGLHIPIAYDYFRDILTNTNRCIVQTNLTTFFFIIDGFFFSLYNGAIIPLLLCLTALMICRNVKISRQKVTIQQFTKQNQNINSNKINRHMIKMLLVQIILTTILNIPYVVLYLFAYYNQKSLETFSLLLYIIFAFIARWFYYMNYSKTFYINTLTSTLFRKSLRKQFIYFIYQY